MPYSQSAAETEKCVRLQADENAGSGKPKNERRERERDDTADDSNGVRPQYTGNQ